MGRYATLSDYDLQFTVFDLQRRVRDGHPRIRVSDVYRVRNQA